MGLCSPWTNTIPQRPNTRSREPVQVIGSVRRIMVSVPNFCVLVFIIAVVTSSGFVSSIKDDFVDCDITVKNWAAEAHDGGIKEDKMKLQDLLFFLHVPRTGGRTYFHCFLRKLYTSDQECPRSYDKLRFNPSKPNCKLMVTHDDHSMMSKLPKERTSVVTILRNPVDRVFSTYEFSVEVAARFLVHPNLSSATQMTRLLRPKGRGVSTLDIWPWKYLVPWMREDLFTRRNTRKRRNIVEIEEHGDSYNMEDMVMPLREFINEPLAHEIIHNGATFQVAGLTNNSYLPESHDVRHCVRKHPSLGKYVLEIAKKRLDEMLYVGLTENHKESATMFADVVGLQVLSQLQALNSQIEQAARNGTDLSSTFPDSEPDDSDKQLSSMDGQNTSEIPSVKNVEMTTDNMTVEKLMGAYEVCISSLRKAQAVRRSSSLKRISPVNFSKEGRLHVQETVLQQILSLNSLDIELYKHAQELFVQQQKHLRKAEIQKGTCSNSNWCPTWKVFSAAIVLLLFIVSIFFHVTRRRRSSKLKV